MAASSNEFMEMAMVDPVDQLINLTLPNGLQESIPLSIVDDNTALFVCKSISYGAELGASVVMLAVILTMTPKAKFWRFTTFLNIAALCNNIIRVLLLAIYFESSWVAFYTLYSGDLSYVAKVDVVNSVASTVMSIQQNIMMMTALIIQAWAMVKLWPRAHKWGIFIVSVVLVLWEMGFMVAAEAYQITNALPWEPADILLEHLWVRYGFLALEVICICWFCFLFNVKLGMHLWKNRGFLHQGKGLSAMDALVMTNGALMLIPVIFACLQYASNTKFEAGSMVYTSVIIVLPLGTLVAQRIADPTVFGNSDLGNGSTPMGNQVDDRFGRFIMAKKHQLLNPSWGRSDKNTGSSLSSSCQSGSNNGLSGKSSEVSSTTSASIGNYKAATVEPLDMIDLELARIDADLEAGMMGLDYKV